MSEVSGLLKRVSAVRKICLSVCRQDDSDFNIFHLCGVDRHEVKHSRIIAEFLNPKATHGLGERFLQHFFRLSSVKDYLKQVPDFPNAETCDWSSACVCVEESYEGGRERLDIAIHWHGWCFIIENKIDAGDQQKQLVRYEADVIKANERPVIFYLTLDGHEPSADSAGSTSYTCLSYSQDIVDWIGACVREAYDRPYLRESLNQYRNLILELSNGNKESPMNEAVVNAIVTTPEDFESANAISLSMQSARAKIAKMLMEDLQSFMKGDPVFDGWSLNDNDLYSFVQDTGSRKRSWHNFSIEGHKQYEKYFSLRGEFQIQGYLKSLFIGFNHKLTSSNKDSASRFLAAARQLQSLRRYQFYSDDDPTAWLYGKWPDGEDVDLSFPEQRADTILASLVDGVARKAFAERLERYLSRMLTEAMGVVKQIDK